LDLDNFKKINDTFGHSIGDNYLKQFTTASTEAIGAKGNLYRMSGDEFVILYMRRGIISFLESFNKTITDFFDMDIPFLGVSIGYAKFPQDANTVDSLIKVADKVMYKVKKQT